MSVSATRYTRSTPRLDLRRHPHPRCAPEQPAQPPARPAAEPPDGGDRGPVRGKVLAGIRHAVAPRASAAMSRPSPYARQFLDRMDKPQVDRIEGVPPAIAIDQTNLCVPRASTVGTMTELADHFKLLYARRASALPLLRQAGAAGFGGEHRRRPARARRGSGRSAPGGVLSGDRAVELQREEVTGLLASRRATASRNASRALARRAGRAAGGAGPLPRVERRGFTPGGGAGGGAAARTRAACRHASGEG